MTVHPTMTQSKYPTPSQALSDLLKFETRNTAPYLPTTQSLKS